MFIWKLYRIIDLMVVVMIDFGIAQLFADVFLKGMLVCVNDILLKLGDVNIFKSFIHVVRLQLLLVHYSICWIRVENSLY
jgi:hypothetical protein